MEHDPDGCVQCGKHIEGGTESGHDLCSEECHEAWCIENEPAWLDVKPA